MSSTHLIRWSGLASMIGGMLWLLLSTGLAIKWPIGEYLGPVLAAVGCSFLVALIGLYARANRRVGLIGKIGLVMAAIGVIPVMTVGILKTIHTGDSGWLGFMLIANLLFAGLVIFGVDALRMQVRSPWAVWPAVIGLTGLTIWGIESQTSAPWQLVGLLYLFGLGWILLGYGLWSDREEQASYIRLTTE